ncbi:mannonate dehydratase [Flavihumibacter petaseus NBRC 106054]|uniref:Mannonate dehydratase n=2 Tax=Flavihumibacter TaxID=1004301 RepID=A0A0E9N3T0_9BACT|nr:mannonate dehydratase [Flavihumibacter petaseus NBRC 106054]
MRWYGPDDVVSLADIRQAGCSAVVTALHQVPVGEVWTVAAIEERKSMIEAAGMVWEVVESLPVHEDIKKGLPLRDHWISFYRESLRNLAACGIKVVTYNFMPVLDWIRTDIAYTLPEGSKALYFDRKAFTIFDNFLLARPGAAKDYTPEELEIARQHFEQMPEAEKEKLFRNCMLGLPGSKIAFTRDQVLQALSEYAGIDSTTLKDHLFYFLRNIIPDAAAAGIKMAIHPDDPPYPVLGLPRILSTASDVDDLLAAVPDPANGLCFCTGSFGARADNQLVDMIRQYGQRIHFLHLRNTKRNENGDFFEASHLEGDADMYAIMGEIFRIMQERKISLPMRPDHGHQMLDDLHKDTYPGYSAIGRLKGLAELRGLEYAISREKRV